MKLYFFLLLIVNSILYSQTYVKMELLNGVYQIPCKVNGIDMKFILDTGASKTSISITEAKFLAKQGLLKEEDILDKQKFRLNGQN